MRGKKKKPFVIAHSKMNQQESLIKPSSVLSNQNSLLKLIDVTFAKILKSCAEKDYSIENLIQSYDPKNTGKLELSRIAIIIFKIGYISFFTLSYLLNEFCALDPIEIDKLKEVFDPVNKNSVFYQDFLDMLNDFQNQQE